MVLAGEFLERSTLIPRPRPGADSLTLEGLYHRGEQAPGVVICAPHPRMGGSMDSPVVAELAWALSRAGHATLRFNYQGVGASHGTIQATSDGLSPNPATIDAVEEEIEDARAAVSQLRASVSHQRVAIAGYSFGAAVALGIARGEPLISHLILVAPPTRLFDFAALQEVTQPTLVVAGHKDAWVDRLQISELVANRTDAAWEVIAVADHTFSRGLTELGDLVVGWLDPKP